MKRTLFFRCCAGLCLPVLSASALAAVEVEVGVTSRYTDNALRTNNNEISERQDEFSAALLVDYENSLIDLDTDYRASENRFDKETQPDRSMLEGNTELLIGKAYHPVDLLLVHSRRSVLGAQDQVNLLQNEDERQIFSAIPTGRIRLSRVDNLLIRGDYTKVDFRYADILNSERTGGSLIWQHRFSSISEMQVEAQHTVITYDALPNNDYEFQSASITYETELRYLSYRLSAGYSVSNPEVGEEFSAPTYRAEIDYRSGFNTFSLLVNQEITDTSLGDGNRGLLDDVNLDDATGVGLDQFKSRVVELRWQNQSLCGRCSAYASLLYEEEQYQNLIEDNNQNVASIGLDYQISRASSVGFQASRQERRFESEVNRTDFTVTSVGVNYRYTFINDLDLRLFFIHDDSESDGDTLTYKENISGVTLTYRF